MDKAVKHSLEQKKAQRRAEKMRLQGVLAWFALKRTRVTLTALGGMPDPSRWRRLKAQAERRSSGGGPQEEEGSPTAS